MAFTWWSASALIRSPDGSGLHFTCRPGRVDAVVIQDRLGGHGLEAVRHAALLHRYHLGLRRADGLVLEILRRGDARAREREHLHHAGRGVIAIGHDAQVQPGVGLRVEEVDIVSGRDIHLAVGQRLQFLADRLIGVDADIEARASEAPVLDGEVERRVIDARGRRHGDRDRPGGASRCAPATDSRPPARRPPGRRSRRTRYAMAARASGGSNPETLAGAGLMALLRARDSGPVWHETDGSDTAVNAREYPTRPKQGRMRRFTSILDQFFTSIRAQSDALTRSRRLAAALLSRSPYLGRGAPCRFRQRVRTPPGSPR